MQVRVLQRWRVPVAVLLVILLAGTVLWRRARGMADARGSTRAGVVVAPGEATVKPAAESLVNEQVLRGNYVFEQNCAVCHGRRGDGRGDMAEGMRPKPRKLTLGIFKFRSTPTGFLPTDDDLERTILRGLANSSMPTFAHLPARDVTAVVAFLKTLSPRWLHSENFAEPLPLPAEPEWLTDAAAAKPHQAAGKKLFAVQCAACHGARADGQSSLAAELVDLAEEPCPPTDLTSEALKAGAEPLDIFRVLLTGLDGTPMPSFREGLSDEERWDLVAFLRSVRTH